MFGRARTGAAVASLSAISISVLVVVALIRSDRKYLQVNRHENNSSS